MVYSCTMAKLNIADMVPSDVDKALAQFSPLTRTLLFNRGMTDAQEAVRFLAPDWERDIHDPFLILNMERAVDRILLSIEKKEHIVIYGDYDCDGIPASVVLHDFFKKIGYNNFENYIPHRHKEGYGLHIHALDEFAKRNTKLLITVDLGITDVGQVEHANKLGIDMIITDHHLPQEVLPPAYAIINSKQKDDTYPDPMLCGAGVAFKLVQALLKKGRFDVHEGWEKWLLDMAGLSTIADMVPLKNENRALAYFGLKVLQKSPRKGLQKLLRKAGVYQPYMTEGDVGFMVAPRINAASRMGVPRDAFTLLSTTDEVEADTLTKHLHDINNKRKTSTALIMKELKKTFAEREPREVVVVGNPQWHVGILGIIASNLVEQFNRPAFVWGRDDNDMIKGSCRSDGSVDLVELMGAVSKDVFEHAGGHAAAGGFTVSKDHIHNLEEELSASYLNIKKDVPEKSIFIDRCMTLDEVNWKTFDEIKQFAPFGVDNHCPVFLFRDVSLARIDLFGKEKNHLKVIMQKPSGDEVSAIGFFMNERTFETPLEGGQKVDLVASLEKEVFRGAPSVRLRIIDISNIR